MTTREPAAAEAPRQHHWIPTAWAVLLSLLVIGPILGRGFVLSYDMVWVPDLSMRTGLLGLSPALPRAVPSDAVVAALDELIPGMLLQKLVLLGALVAGGVGIARLVRGSTAAGVIAVSVFLWSPFVAERLWIGHWPLLLGWAALPWVVRLAREHRDGCAVWPALAAWLLIGSLSPNAGLMTGFAALVAGLGSPTRSGQPARRAPSAMVLASTVMVANLPWLVAGLAHAGTAVTEGTALFSLHSDGQLPAPLAALALGGIWNAEVVPSSRDTVLAWIGLAGLVGLGVIGARRWWARDSLRRPLLACWLAGLGMALLPVVLPGVVEELVRSVPGAGLIRDSARFLALAAPLTAVVAAAATDALLERASGPAVRVPLVIALALFPLMVLPDLAWGVGGALRPVDYPASYAQARSALATAERDQPGDVVILPFTSYRAPPWNGGRKVFAPLGRVLTPNDVTNDDLVVSGQTVPGEDPRGPEVRAALGLATPAARSRALAALGIQYAAVEPQRGSAPGSTEPALAGKVLFSAAEVRIIDLDATATKPRLSTLTVTWIAAAWVAWLALVTVMLATLAGRWARRVVPFRRPR